MDAGEFTTSTGGKVWNAEQVSAVRLPPGESRPVPFSKSTISPKMSEYDSFSAPGCHCVNQVVRELGVGVRPLVARPRRRG